MKTIDLDDAPPRLAALLTGLAEGEELILVQNGVVVGRLTGGPPASAPVPAPEPEPAITAEERAKEIFENFRSAMEDDF